MRPRSPSRWILAAVLGPALRVLLSLSLGVSLGPALGVSVAAAAPWGPIPPPLPSSPFRLGSWVVEGDALIDAAELSRILPWAPADSIGPEVPPEAARRVERRLREAGWWAARVRVEVGDEREGARDMALRIEAGARVVVGELGIAGNRLLTREEILSRMELRTGQAFELATLEGDAERVLRAYSERGYPLARVYPGRFRRTDDGRLSFVLRVGEGPAAAIESVRFLGSRDTDERMVARIAGVRPGDSWDVRKLERMSSRLRREGLFTFVGEPRVVIGSRDNLLGIEIEVEEGPSSSVFGVLGYNPRRGGGGDVVGLAELDLRNLLGTARRASLRFEKQVGDVRDLRFRYREPWVLGSPVSVEAGAAQALRDTLYSRTDLDLGASIPTGDFATFRLAAERRSSSFDDASGASVSETATGGSARWEIDLRDRRVNPTRGWLGDLLVGARETEEGVLRSRVEAGAGVLVPWGRRLVVSEEAAFRGVWSTEGDIPLHDQFYLGGTTTLRGYREEQFHGERVWWIRSELRYRLGVRSRAYLLGDVGGYDFEVRPSGAPARREQDVLFGAGVGAALETRGSGIVRFELALGRGDGFSDAKVHVGIETEF